MVFHSVLSNGRGGVWPCKIPIVPGPEESEGMEMCCVHASNESPPCVATAAASWQTAGERAVSACMLVETRNNPISSWNTNSSISRCGGVFSLARARQEREREDNIVHAPIVRHNKLDSSRAADSLDACAERMRRLDSMVSGGASTIASIPSIVATCITATGTAGVDTTSNAVAVTESSTSVRHPRGSTFALLSHQANSKEQRRHEIVNRSSELDRRLTLKNPKAYPAGAHAPRTSSSRPTGSRQDVAMLATSSRTTEPRRRHAERAPVAAAATAAAEW